MNTERHQQAAVDLILAQALDLARGITSETHWSHPQHWEQLHAYGERPPIEAAQLAGLLLKLDTELRAGAPLPSAWRTKPAIIDGNPLLLLTRGDL
jgi:hypothetical protein